MSILDKLAKAFGFKSDDDLKKKQEKEESKGASKKESVDQYHKDLTGNWLLNTVGQSHPSMHSM